MGSVNGMQSIIGCALVKLEDQLQRRPNQHMSLNRQE